KLELLKKYSDLREVADQYGIVRLVSAKANRHVTDVEIRNACDCCPDANVLAYPYLTVNNLNVYSDPVCFKIGCRSEQGIMGNWEWEDEMYSKRIAGAVVVKV